MAIALVASLLSEIRFGTLRVPVVVWEMMFGILIGPYALGLVRPGGFMQWFGQGPGLAALFFMAGMELDLQKVKGRPLSLAIRGWILSLGLGLAAAAVLHSLPGIQAPMMVGLVLTTTALGTFMPILRDTGNLDSRFGSFVLAAGAAGEFAPIMVVSLVLTRKFGAWQEIVLMLAFVAVAVGAALIALGLRPPRVLKLLERTMHSSTQLPVCLSPAEIAQSARSTVPQRWNRSLLSSSLENPCELGVTQPRVLPNKNVCPHVDRHRTLGIASQGRSRASVMHGGMACGTKRDQVLIRVVHIASQD